MKSVHRNAVIILNTLFIIANGISGLELSPAKAGESDSKLTENLDYTKDFSAQFNPDGLSILNKLSCGDREADHVTEGNETVLGEFPWMALLRSDLQTKNFICAGSLISNRYVLTVANCFFPPKYRNASVRLGEHDLTTNPDCSHGVCNPVVEDFGIDSILIHPNYDPSERINDIALIKLSRNVEFKRHIKPICLPVTKQSFESSSKNFTISGWGIPELKKSPVLLKAPVLEEERSACRIDLPEKEYICTKYLQKTGSETCNGDGGGPLVSLNLYNDDKRFVQYGVLAAGVNGGCSPEIYTNVLTFMPWITNTIVE